MRALVIAAAALALIPASAHGQGPAEPYDGTIPFECVLQQAGMEAEFPDPDADPFCVEYDKRHQNVSQGGVVEFLSLEPARVAAASPKCFYYQRDHWVGSIVQDDGRTETYAWDGSYYFDKAKGAGGAYVENFTFNNQSGDPTAVPGFPEEWKPNFGYGRGGVHSTGTVDADPACVAKAEENPPYRKEPGASPEPSGCPEAAGGVGRSIGGLSLGATRSETREQNGKPRRRKRGFFRYCITGGGKYMAGFGRKRAQFLLTTNPGFSVNGVRRLTPKRQAHRRLRGEKELFRTSKTVVWGVRKRDHVLLVVIRHRKVAGLASAVRGLGWKRLFAYYKASR